MNNFIVIIIIMKMTNIFLSLYYCLSHFWTFFLTH